MDRERIDRINADLLERTGIDFSRYRDPQLSEAVANAVTFPLYLGKALTRPVGLLLLLTVAAFVLTESAFLKTLLVFPGSLLVVANGVLLGLVLFIGRIRTDMKTVFDISSNLCVQALKDIGAARAKMRDRGRFPSTLEIFQGLNAIVILPLVIETLKRRVPFAGGLGAWVTERFFNIADARLAAAIARRAPGPPSAVELRPAEVAGWLDSAEKAVHAVQVNIGKVIDTVGRVVAFPFFAVLIAVAVVSIGLFYAAWQLTL